MAIRYNIETHASAYPTKVLASNGGKHIYNVQVETDTDQGNFVAKGDAVELDLYKEKAASAFKGVILPFKAANGNFYVEVTEAGDALFVYSVPLIEEEYSSNFKKESNFFNAAGSTVRAYELAPGDIIEVSEEAFDGTPTVGAAVTGINNKKMTVA